MFFLCLDNLLIHKFWIQSYFHLIDESLANIITIFVNKGMIDHFLPIRSLLRIKHYQEFDEVKSLLRWPVAIELEGFFTVKYLLWSYLLIEGGGS